jgi:hypothetical protein
MSFKNAVSAIERHGALLVFPIDNRKEPASIWSVLYPRSEMRWEWDDGGDNRVAKLWHLREELSRSGKVVYTKWFRGRATFFSRDVFAAMLSLMGSTRLQRSQLSRDSLLLLETLRSDSPLSTKELKKLSDMRGKQQEAAYTRALKDLWTRLLIVGYGEVDDGAFPSLALGSSEILFEDLWAQAHEMSETEAYELLRAKIPSHSLFIQYFQKQLRSLRERLPVSHSSVHSH